MKIKLLLLLPALLMVLKGTAQFSGAFAPANWSYSSTTPGGDGSINISGAPASIILSGSDNGGGGSGYYEQYVITVAQTGTIAFDYNHVNEDIDEAYYVINGTQTLLSVS